MTSFYESPIAIDDIKESDDDFHKVKVICETNIQRHRSDLVSWKLFDDFVERIEKEKSSEIFLKWSSKRFLISILLIHFLIMHENSRMYLNRKNSWTSAIITN